MQYEINKSNQLLVRQDPLHSCINQKRFQAAHKLSNNVFKHSCVCP